MNPQEKEFADYETSKMLKELGFNEAGCFQYFDRYGNDLPCHQLASSRVNNDFRNDDRIMNPLWQQVKQWLWEKHRIYFDVLQKGYFKSRGFFSHASEAFVMSGYWDSPIEAEQDAVN